MKIKLNQARLFETGLNDMGLVAESLLGGGDEEESRLKHFT